MKSKFKFKPVEKTFSDPAASIFRPGVMFGREYSRGDIVLLNPEISVTKVVLNSKVLREALLESKDFIEEALGLIISDAKNIKEEPVKTETKAKKTSKKEEETVIEEPVKTETNNLILEEEPLVTNE